MWSWLQKDSSVVIKGSSVVVEDRPKPTDPNQQAGRAVFRETGCRDTKIGVSYNCHMPRCIVLSTVFLQWLKNANLTCQWERMLTSPHPSSARPFFIKYFCFMNLCPGNPGNNRSRGWRTSCYSSRHKSCLEQIPQGLESNITCGWFSLTLS